MLEIMKKMKRILVILFAFFTISSLFAQSENNGSNIPDFESQRYKEFDGFILDMGPMFDMPAYLIPPTLSFKPFDMSMAGPYAINPDAVRIDKRMIFSGNQSFSYSPVSYAYPGSFGSNVRWQGASYKLNNGVRINTYGEYNADGYKVYNPAAMPWERNNFNAAFEVKSPDGKFGIKVEMHGGRKNAY